MANNSELEEFEFRARLEAEQNSGSAPEVKGNAGAASQPGAIPQQPADLEQILGPSDFTKSFASTPARMLKSTMQMVGAGDYVPEVVSRAAAEGDKSLPGRIVGDIAGTGGIRAGAGALAQSLQRLNAAKGILPAVGRTAEAATYGSAQGALTTPDDQLNAAKMGAVGGAAGQVIGRVTGGLVRPTDEARVLLERGVGLTPGQAAGAGSIPARLEQAATSLPFAGAPIRAAQRRAVNEANRAAAQTVVDIPNLTVEKVKLGMPPREAVEQARETVKGAYDQALSDMDVPAFFPQASLMQRMDNLPNEFPLLPARDLRAMERFVNARVGDLAKQSGGKITGEQLKQLDSELGQHVRNLATSTNAADKTAAPAWAELQQSLREVMTFAQADPAKQEQLKAANQAYRQLLALERALLPGAESFTPRQLARQVNKAKLRGTELNAVSEAMNKTLPNSLPDSGTAERLLTAGLPALLMGGGAGAQSLGWDTLGTGMMAAGALGSRPGARFLTGSMAGQQALAEALRKITPTVARNLNNETDR